MKNRTKRRICAWISFLGFVVAYGAVGAVEQNLMGLGAGIPYMFGGVAVFGLAAYKGGYMR